MASSLPKVGTRSFPRVYRWELGKNKRVKDKADSDYQKRRDEPGEVDPEKATFVFVTPRRWGGKEAWSKARREEDVFRDVKAYDADDLETWLEQAPGVHLWFSRLVGKSPRDALDLEFFWEGWSGATTPETSPTLVVSGRDDRRRSWRPGCRGSRRDLRVKGRISGGLLAFFAATVYRMPEEQRERQLSRCVLVSDPATWRELAESRAPLALIPTFDAEGMVAGAASADTKSSCRWARSTRGWAVRSSCPVSVARALVRPCRGWGWKPTGGRMSLRALHAGA